MQFDIDLNSPQKDLFLAAREYLLSFPGMVEIKKPRITTYAVESGEGAGNICHMRTMPHGIDLGFLKGAKMVDEPGLLTGKGKAMRVLPLIELNEDAIMYYVKQAIVLNKAK